jgi:hypothetical protein
MNGDPEPKNASLSFDPCCVMGVSLIGGGLELLDSPYPPKRCQSIYMHNYAMYIIAIGWLWVALLMAITESSVVAGIFTLFLWGLVPCSIMLWMSGSKVRRQRKAYQELLASQRTNNDDGSDTKPDK